MKRARGRPRKFDAEQVLGNALLVFWTKGFAGTSLDDLAHAMAMKRPSIYNAFGDKQSLYRAALGAFQDRLNSGPGLLLVQQDAKVAAQLTQANLQSLALRSRAGQSRPTLNRMAKGAVEMIRR